MTRAHYTRFSFLSLLSFGTIAVALPLFGQPSQPIPKEGNDRVATPPAAPTSSAPAVTESGAKQNGSAQTRGEVMRAYHDALATRRLGQVDITLDDLRDRIAEAEDKMATGRVDEAIARLTELVEHPKFELFRESDEARAAIFRLGDALAQAGIVEPARAYLRRVIELPGAWNGSAPYTRRAVRRLVDIALDDGAFAAGESDLRAVPPSAPEETRSEVSYMNGRAREAAGDPDGALAEYSRIPATSRFWAQSTYLQGLILVEKGRFTDGENAFCKVADPKRQAQTAPVFADERYFRVRDLARLALGRVAHEQGRNDDARYYYYLVPRDSERLAEALYESATTRYEKKDYDGARELLDELKALKIHHPYEDEADVLDAYVDLARCKFESADKKLVAFVNRYEPVRDAARTMLDDDRAVSRLLVAARTGSDAASSEIGGTKPDELRALAALVRLDRNYGSIAKRRNVLEREASGVRAAHASAEALLRSMKEGGAGTPHVDTQNGDDSMRAEETDRAIDGIRAMIRELEAAKAPADRIATFKKELAEIETRAKNVGTSKNSDRPGGETNAGDLAALLSRDANGDALSVRIERARAALFASETTLAKDALSRLDVRLSRLLRRARLGRIESVLGRKRGLEVENEAIGNGYLPQAAFDSLDAARFLQDNEEYWPFEGDDWPDEYVGSEVVK